MSTDLPAPDAIEGAPHPRETPTLIGQSLAEEDFLTAYTSGRMHSGWLLCGPQGVGKATLAYRIAAFLLAEPGDDGLFGAPEDLLGAPPAPTSLTVDPDGPDMRQILAGAHPRLCVVTRGPNATGSALSDVITVERVRKIKDFFHMSAADGGRRVVIVDAADDLNRSAANALLKELEEPPARTTLLLIAHQPSRLLPTIRSRCRVLRCAPLAPDALSQALTQAGAETSPATLALAAGSVGDAIRLQQMEGAALYDRILSVLAPLPRLDRSAANGFADSLTGRGADGRFVLALDLLDMMLARLARTALTGPPDPPATPEEPALFARLCPTPAAAQDWATLAARLQGRLRHGRAVNIDASALMLDALLQIEACAQRHT